MAASCFKDIGTETTMAGKVIGTKKEQLEEHFVTNEVHWQRVGNMNVC